MRVVQAGPQHHPTCPRQREKKGNSTARQEELTGEMQPQKRGARASQEPGGGGAESPWGAPLGFTSAPRTMREETLLFWVTWLLVICHRSLRGPLQRPAGPLRRAGQRLHSPVV